METLLKTANFRPPPFSLSNTRFSSAPLFNNTFNNNVKFKSQPRNNFHCLVTQNKPSSVSQKRNAHKFVSFSSSTTEEAHDPQIQDNTDGDVIEEVAEEVLGSDDKPGADESSASPVMTALQLYKEALSSNDESKISELEAFFKSIEDEKNALERNLASTQEAFSVERDRVLRISADFDNFRKRTERERQSLVSNAQGEVIENFLGVLDNFERAKSQLKIETEAEEKINKSYQSIYKQFTEILGSIGVLPVETVGKPFDPSFHEAIMREESSVYDEGVVIEEYRKGFKLGERLLRPSMVKVSAGPGPQTSEATTQESDATQTAESDVGEGDVKDESSA